MVLTVIVFIQHVLAIESRVFSLESPASFYALYSPALKMELSTELDSIAKQVTSFSDALAGKNLGWIDDVLECAAINLCYFMSLRTCLACFRHCYIWRLSLDPIFSPTRD